MKINSNITVREVKNDDELKEFVMFPHKLYKDSKYWVAPIIKEEFPELSRQDLMKKVGELWKVQKEEK